MFVCFLSNSLKCKCLFFEQLFEVYTTTRIFTSLADERRDDEQKKVCLVYHLSFTTKYRRILFKKKKKKNDNNNNNNNNNNNSKETALPHIRIIHIIKSSR